MDYPLVSIITPTYKHEKFIEACIKSVIKQSYTNWEMLIVNDGSPDKTSEIVNQFATKDSRIILIEQENVGIFRLDETYNKALEFSKGKYIAILEGDDYWMPEKLNIQVKIMENQPDVVMAWGRAESRIEFSEKVYHSHPINFKKNNKYYNNTPPVSIFNAIFNDFLPPLTFLIRRSRLIQIGGFIQINPSPGVDLSTVLELSKLGRFYYSDEVLGVWRNYPEQTTKNYTIEVIEGVYKIINPFYDKLDDKIKRYLVIDKAFLIKDYKRRKVIAYSRGGRFKLIRREFKKARKDFLNAILYGGFLELNWKIKSFGGLILSFLHIDAEKILQLLGKKTLK